MLFYLNYNTFITNEGVTTMLHPGLYEQVINNVLTSELAEIPEARKAIAPIEGGSIQGAGAVSGRCGSEGLG